MNILVDGQVFSSPEKNRGIGVYCKNVLTNLVRRGIDDNWFIVTDDLASLDHLDNDVRCRLITVLHPVFRPGTDYAREEEYTEKLIEVVERFSIDVYWNPDPMMVNVLFPSSELPCRFFVTMYDLIPYIMPVKEWPDQVKEEYRRRIEFLKKSVVTQICISKATQQDVFNCMGGDINTVVTPLAADRNLFYRETSRDELNPYLVFTGGFDYRKNMRAAVEAFQLFLDSADKKESGKIKFYLVCACTDEQREELYGRIRAEYRDQVVVTGFLPDKELAELYAHASVFFFPSCYEGFGLPIVEAMLGGAFVLSADNSSLPEVCGGHALLCDAGDVEDMAKKLGDSYKASCAESVEDRVERQEYALMFSWEKTANRTYAAFSTGLSETVPKCAKIALVTPWPTMQTGIANYVYKLMPALSEYFDIDVFIDNTYVKDQKLLENEWGGLFNICELSTRYKDYDEIVYELGNNAEFHTGVYKHLRAFPGIAEVHDYNVSGFFFHSFFLKGDKDSFRRALVDGYGQFGADYYSGIEQGRPFDGLYPMNESLSRIAKATIYHNAWSMVQASKAKNLFFIPHASFDKEAIDENSLEDLSRKVKEKMRYKDGNVVIAMLGFVNENKRYSVLLKAVRKLLNVHENVQLVFIGAAASENVDKQIVANRLEDHASVMGYLEKDEYEIALQHADIVVNLRYPSMGESSGTLCEAFQYKKPVIVSAINQYLEFPDSVCWKLPVYKDEDDEAMNLFFMLEEMVKRPEIRTVLGENAFRYATDELSPKRIARKYYDVISRVRNGE